MNKASIIAKIQSVLTGNVGVTTRTQHEEALYTDADSILEAVYSDVISETHASPSIFSPKTVDIEYDLKVSKVGRFIKVNGSITNTGTSAVLGLVDITNSDYYPSDLGSQVGMGFLNPSEPLMIFARNFSTTRDLTASGVLLPSEMIRISITYNTQS